MLTIYHGGTGRQMPNVVTEFKPGSWIHLEKPLGSEIEEAARLLAVNPDTIRDSLDPYEVPRFEVAAEGTYIFIRYPDESGTTPFLIVLAESGILTVAQKANPILEMFAETGEGPATTQKNLFVLRIIAEADERYASALVGIRKDVNRKKVTPDKMTVEDIVDFASYEAIANDFMDALVPQQVVLGKIISGKVLTLTSPEGALADDLVLSTNQLIESSRATLKTISNIRSAHTAISTERLNHVIRRLTAFTVLLAVPTAVTSFYGMNMHLPGAAHPHAAVILGGILGIIVILLLGLFIKNDWL